MMRNNRRRVKYLFGGFEKANSRKGATGFLEVIASVERGNFFKKVKRSVLDIECPRGTSKNTAVEIDWYLKFLDDPDPF